MPRTDRARSRASDGSSSSPAKAGSRRGTPARDDPPTHRRPRDRCRKRRRLGRVRRIGEGEPRRERRGRYAWRPLRIFDDRHHARHWFCEGRLPMKRNGVGEFAKGLVRTRGGVDQQRRRASFRLLHVHVRIGSVGDQKVGGLDHQARDVGMEVEHDDDRYSGPKALRTLRMISPSPSATCSHTIAPWRSRNTASTRPATAKRPTSSPTINSKADCVTRPEGDAEAQIS